MSVNSYAQDRAGGPITVTWLPDGVTTPAQLAELPAATQISVAGVAVVARRGDHRDPVAPQNRPLTIRHDHAGQIFVDVHARTWPQARQLTVEVLLGLIAYRGGLIYQPCEIVDIGQQTVLVTGQAGSNAPEPTPHVLVDAGSATVTAHLVFPEELWRNCSPATVSKPVGAIALLTDDDPARYAAPKLVRAHLRARGGARRTRLAAVIAEGTDPQLLADLDAATETHLHSLSVALAAVCVSGAALPTLAHHDRLLLPQAAEFAPAALAGLRDMQRTAAGVYGRLEVGRAIAWTAEELGEVAKAMRRQESPACVGEELGQLFTWILNLANISELDLAAWAQRALSNEGGRQLVSHGRLRPYESAPFRDGEL